MSTDPIQTAAERAWRDVCAELPDAAALSVEVGDEAPVHPRFPASAKRYAHWTGDTLQVHAGSFRSLAEGPGAVDLDTVVHAFVSMRLEDETRGRLTVSAAPDEAQVLAWHADFRQERDLPYAWYRAGELLDERTWAVDLDVFTEVWITRADWDRLHSGPAGLQLGEDTLDLEFPDDADPGDWITLEGAGLFEDELYDDEPVPTSGDLHLLFFVV